MLLAHNEYENLKYSEIMLISVKFGKQAEQALLTLEICKKYTVMTRASDWTDIEGIGCCLSNPSSEISIYDILC